MKDQIKQALLELRAKQETRGESGAVVFSREQVRSILQTDELQRHLLRECRRFVIDVHQGLRPIYQRTHELIKKIEQSVGESNG